jgi:hypothetical protein
MPASLMGNLMIHGWQCIYRDKGHRGLRTSLGYSSIQLGHAVAKMVEALCYKPEGRRFESRLGYSIFSIDQILTAALGPVVYSASNINEYQKHKNHVFGE